MTFRTPAACLSAALLTATTGGQAHAFGYIFAGDANGLDVVTHPLGYGGQGGVVQIDVGIRAGSANAAAMEIATQNVVAAFNGLAPTTGNVNFAPFANAAASLSAAAPVVSSTPLVSHTHECSFFCASDHGAPSVDSNSNPASFEVDFESVLLHEMGHSFGLSHVNAASESGLGAGLRDYTKATVGANGVFDLDAGPDGVIGSADDLRGDDVNLNWFHTATNDPFSLANTAGVVDSTTYTRDTADLPAGDSFSANPSRDVAALPRYDAANTEAAMQQGTFSGETQRTLGADDVAGLRYAMAGLDELEGTADDYFFELNYVGIGGDADIFVGFDDAETGFAVSKSGGQFLAVDHVAITGTEIFFNTGSNWHFNDTLVPEPGTAAALAAAGLLLLRRRSAAACEA